MLHLIIHCLSFIISYSQTFLINNNQLLVTVTQAFNLAIYAFVAIIMANMTWHRILNATTHAQVTQTRLVVDYGEILFTLQV